jgi:ABC-type multidrug transport system fused ATPase/permease subunit
MQVLRRGLAESPELRKGLRLTVMFAVIGAVGRLTIPILIQQVIDKGLLADEGFRPAFTLTACGLAAAIIVGVTLLARVTYVRLVTASEHLHRAALQRAGLTAIGLGHRVDAGDVVEGSRVFERGDLVVGVDLVTLVEVGTDPVRDPIVHDRAPSM